MWKAHLLSYSTVKPQSYHCLFTSRILWVVWIVSSLLILTCYWPPHTWVSVFSCPPIKSVLCLRRENMWNTGCTPFMERGIFSLYTEIDICCQMKQGPVIQFTAWLCCWDVIYFKPNFHIQLFCGLFLIHFYNHFFLLTIGLLGHIQWDWIELDLFQLSFTGRDALLGQ